MSRLLALLTTLLAAVSLHAQQGYYGYCPMDATPDEVNTQGTGRNNFIEAAVCLDTEADPLFDKLRLSGATILGVRFYIINDYKQRAQQRSLIEIRQGSLADAPVAKKVDNFVKGWNEVLFSEPVPIVQGKNYVGYQVYETIGTPYPVATYKPATVPGSCFLSANREPFVEMTDRGTLLVQAIISGTEAIQGLQHAAMVSFSGVPTMMVHPAKLFDCQLYVRNLSSSPITTVEFEGTDADGNVNTYTATLATPLQPYDGRVIPYQLVAPASEGISQPLTLRVTKVDGHTAADTRRTTANLYVALDAYERLPIVEEFTSQYCVNCPFMIYFLDRAIEAYRATGKPLLYVTHHSGFQPDRFTVPADNDLTYLFFGDTYNPAVMYDRRILAEQTAIVQSAKVAETEPYTNAINEMALYPAYAEVNIEPIKAADGKIGARVTGSINRYLLETGVDVYLSCYLVEDGIPVSDSYFQYGLEEEEGAPEDLQETFRHNGVIRCAYNENGAGDRLTIIPGDSYTYDVTYAAKSFRSDTNLDNCDLVALVHLVDRNNPYNNYVLNAGSARHQGYYLGTIPAGLQGQQTTDNGQQATLYDLTGRRIAPTARGLFIQNGHKVLR